MEEMKSALQRAMERAESLGSLSPEEMRSRKQEEYVPVGEGIAKKYLEHGITSLLVEDANKHTGEEGRIVLQALLSRLVGAVGLSEYERSARALKGILSLKRNEHLENLCTEIDDLVRAYAQARLQENEANRGSLVRAIRESLHQMRISGTAVGEANAEAGKTRGDTSPELQSQFDAPLVKLKESLSRALAQP